MRFALFILLSVGFIHGHAQQLVLPTQPGWTQLEEGKLFSFDLALSEKIPRVKFSLDGSDGYAMALDSVGHFTWTPSYDLVDRIQKQKEINIIFQAEWGTNKKVRQPVNFIVRHVNRPPTIDELPTFYVKQNTPSSYQIPAVYAHDPDGDPIIFKPRESMMPEGAQLSSLGQLSWTPSRNQFNNLKNNPLTLEFIVQDQPDKAETVGKIRIAQTQLDLPPEMLLIPGDSLLNIKENDVVSFKVYVADPNGDDNIDQVGFISSDPRIPKNALKENSKAQAEFTWTPGYDFVEEAEKKKEVIITFFAFDKSSNRVQRRVRISIADTENVEEKDKQLYQRYFNSLASTRNLIVLLDKNSDHLESTYKKAKKGKKNRSLGTAALGLFTGLSPVIFQPDPAKYVTVVGGTSVATINYMEGSQLLGKSATEFQNKMKTNDDLRTQLQLKGNYFARKYSLKSARRLPEFEVDRDELVKLLNSESLPSLDLPADPQGVPTNKEVKKTFSDFSEE